MGNQGVRDQGSEVRSQGSGILTPDPLIPDPYFVPAACLHSGTGYSRRQAPKIELAIWPWADTFNAT